MSSKKLASEIEKCLREAQANILTYDVKWRELKSYNEATANPDWATMGGGCIRVVAPDPVVLGGLKPKRPAPATTISVDISVMSERQVIEAKEKLKNELEILMKKVYRSRQLIIDWLNHVDFRQTGGQFTKDHLIEAKKEIESRHRRGKIYYLRGVSSEDTSNEQATALNDLMNWIQDFIDTFQQKSDFASAEIEKLTIEPQPDSERLAYLVTCIDTYTVHAEKLNDCLRRLRNNAINFQRDAEEQEEEDSPGGGADEHPLTALIARFNNLKEELTPLFEEEDINLLESLPGAEIYDDLLADPGLSSPLAAEPPTRAAAPVTPPARAAPVPTFQPPAQDLRSRLDGLRPKLQTSQGIAAIELEQGVSSVAEEILLQMPLRQRDEVLSELERIANVPPAPGTMPVLIMDDTVRTVEATGDWEDRRSRLMSSGCQSPLLETREGLEIEVLASSSAKRWIFGRLKDNRGVQGWFPSAVVVAR